MWEEVARVPLLVVLPGITTARPIDAPVSTLDVAPTVLDLAKIPQHAEMTGISLAPWIRGATHPLPSRDHVLDSDLEGAAVVHGNHKLIVHPHGCSEEERRPWAHLHGTQCAQLVDLSADQGERQNLIEQQPELYAQLAATLDEELSRRDTPALDEYAEFLQALQQGGYWTHADSQ